MLDLPRSLRLAAWGGAAIAGRVSLDEAADRVVGADAVHRVVGLPGEGEVALTLALGRLRRLQVTALRLALPAPGAPADLPGPPAFNAAAVAAGEAVLAGDRPAYGLVPQVSGSNGGAVVRWLVHPVDAWPAPPGTSVADADRRLQEALREATGALVALDVARWRPEVADALRSLRAGCALGDALAPGHPARAVRVLDSARRVAAIAALAAEDPGAAVSASGIARRSAALAPLESAARAALVAACNAVHEPTAQARTER